LLEAAGELVAEQTRPPDEPRLERGCSRPRLAEPLVGRARLDDERVQATVGTLLDRTAAWLSSGIDKLVAELMRSRVAEAAFLAKLEAFSLSASVLILMIFSLIGNSLVGEVSVKTFDTCQDAATGLSGEGLSGRSFVARCASHPPTMQKMSQSMPAFFRPQ
jgi:hypothetical protein